MTTRHTLSPAQFTQLFHEVGVDDATLERWHRGFEARYPEAHAAFLGWLGLNDDAVSVRRAWGLRRLQHWSRCCPR